MHNPSGRSRASIFFVACLAAGCSSGTYDADYAKAVAAMRLQAEFSRLEETPLELAEGRVRISPPRALSSWLKAGGADPRAQQTAEGEAVPIDPRRLHPPFLGDFPGFVAAYEGVFDGSPGKLPVTLSIGSVPATEQREPQIAARIVDKAREHEGFSKEGFKWAARTVTDRSGVEQAWKVLRLHGPQPIDRWIEGWPPEHVPVEATCEIWLSATPHQEQCTVLAWRVPDEVKDKFDLDEIAPLTARSVKIQAVGRE